MQALTLEVELLVSLLIGFAVPAVPARGERKRVAESTDCEQEINSLKYKNFNAATNAVHDKSLRRPSWAAGAVNPAAYSLGTYLIM